MGVDSEDIVKYVNAPPTAGIGCHAAEMDDKLRALEIEARPVLERTQALSRAHANLESAYETANSILTKMDVPRRLQPLLEKPIDKEAGALTKYLKRVRSHCLYNKTVKMNIL